MQTATAGKGKRRRLAEADLSSVFGIDMEEPLKPSRKKRAPSRKTVPKTSNKRVKNRAVKKTTAVSRKKKPFIPTAVAVARLRKRFKMNTSRFATLVGVTPSTVNNWENATGKLNLRQRTREALIKVAELTPQQAMREVMRIRQEKLALKLQPR